MNSESPTFQLKNVKTALISGASSGIGRALSQNLLNRGIQVVGVSRRPLDGTFTNQYKFFHQQIDLSVEEEVAGSCQFLNQENLIPDLVINSTGFLYDSEKKPERQLKDFDVDFFLKNINANTIPTALLAKHLFPLLKEKPLSVFATITAKVGSITDNRMGGWHSYRASKAAANMMLKNISLEFQRMNCNSICLALHPGTTVTALSEPFIKNFRLKLHSPEETSENLLNVIDGKTLTDTGKFYSWDGAELPW